MDILLTDNGDGGEFVLSGGDIESDSTFFTAVYISLFGGDCFYNVFENYKSDGEFEESLNQPITAANLKNVQAAAHRALKWMEEEGLVNSIEIYAYGDSSEKINVDITMSEPLGTDYLYSVIWDNERAVLKAR